MHAWARRLLVPRVWVPLVVVVLVVALVGVVRRSDASEPPGLTLRQWLFDASVRHAQDRVRDGNPVTLVSSRRARDHQLCAILRGKRAVGWTGRLDDVGTTLHQDGTIKVALDDDVMLHTPSERPLVPGSRPFESVAKLHDGDRVLFTGRFVASGGSCVTSLNLFHRSAVLSPDFAFRFKRIEKAQ